jgi:hypothetical protein
MKDLENEERNITVLTAYKCYIPEKPSQIEFVSTDYESAKNYAKHYNRERFSCFSLSGVDASFMEKISNKMMVVEKYFECISKDNPDDVMVFHTEKDALEYANTAGVRE